MDYFRPFVYACVAGLGLLTAYAGNVAYHRYNPRKWRHSPVQVIRPTLTPTAEPTLIEAVTPILSPLPSLIASITATNTPTPWPTSSGPTATPSPSVSRLKWGAYTGWTTQQVLDLEALAGRKMDYVTTFVHWGNEKELPLDLGNLAKSKGQTLVIFWESMDYNVTSPEDPRFNYQSILRGDWDEYLTEFAAQTKDFGGQVILIPFEEANGDWYPWSLNKNGNSADLHIRSYRYLRKFFNDVPNVRFGWSVNSEPAEGITDNLADFYPGDAFVDYVGINGFNFDNPWVTFSQIFDPGLADLEALTAKPIIIFSFSSAQGPAKAAWITDALTKEIKKHPRIVGWSWFNENKEKDWRINSDTNSLNAFKSGLPN